MISITEAGRDTGENGRDPHLELHSDSKVRVCLCVILLHYCTLVMHVAEEIQRKESRQRYKSFCFLFDVMM